MSFATKHVFRRTTIGWLQSDATRDLFTHNQCPYRHWCPRRTKYCLLKALHSPVHPNHLRLRVSSAIVASLQQTNRSRKSRSTIYNLHFPTKIGDPCRSILSDQRSSTMPNPVRLLSPASIGQEKSRHENSLLLFPHSQRVESSSLKQVFAGMVQVHRDAFQEHFWFYIRGLAIVHSVLILDSYRTYMYMLHAIWELAQSADCMVTVQTKDPSKTCDSFSKFQRNLRFSARINFLTKLPHLKENNLCLFDNGYYSFSCL